MVKNYFHCYSSPITRQEGVFVRVYIPHRVTVEEKRAEMGQQTKKP